MTLTLSLLVGVGVGNSFLYPNLFADYEALWPGQSITSVMGYAQHTPEGYMTCISSRKLPSEAYPGLAITTIYAGLDRSDTSLVCQSSPQHSLFRQITVIIDQDQVQEVALFSDVLQQNTLCLYWAHPMP